MNLTIGCGRTELNYTFRMMGKDVSVCIEGGVSHIGCVAVGDCGEVRNFVFGTHKEDALAVPMAKELSEQLQCVCSVSAGVHLDGITKQEIATILKQNSEAIGALTELIVCSNDMPKKV